jgi:hypothetical protein
VVVDVKVKVKVAVEVVVLAVAVTLAVTLTVFFFKVVVMASRMVFRVVVVESSFLGNLKVVFAWIHSLKAGEPSEIANFEGFTSFCTSPQAREILCKSREMSFLWWWCDGVCGGRGGGAREEKRLMRPVCLSVCLSMSWLDVRAERGGQGVVSFSKEVEVYVFSAHRCSCGRKEGDEEGEEEEEPQGRGMPLIDHSERRRRRRMKKKKKRKENKNQKKKEVPGV